MSKQRYPQATVTGTGELRKRPVKVNGYSNTKSHARRLKRCHQADDRQADYAELSVKERIARAQSRRGKSAKEIARLTVLLSAAVKPPKQETAPVVTPSPVTKKAIKKKVAAK